MTTPINAQGLTPLDRIYRFPGGQVRANSIDLDSAIPLVHDVSRMAEMSPPGTPYHGLFNFSAALTMAVAPGDVFSSQNTDPSAAFWATLGLNPAASWVWILEVSARIASTLTMTEILVSIEQVTFTGAFTSHERAVWRATSQSTIAMKSSGRLSAIGSDLVRMPVLVTPNATIRYAATGGGAVADCTLQLQAWAGPQGILPPGLA